MLNNNNENAETLGPYKTLISTCGSFFCKFHHEKNKGFIKTTMISAGNGRSPDHSGRPHLVRNTCICRPKSYVWATNSESMHAL